MGQTILVHALGTFVSVIIRGDDQHLTLVWQAERRGLQ
jgi:hypothetical protein